MYKILSLDGGGIRGIFSARILKRLEEAVPGFLNDVDLIAGTSTGAILAVLLALGRTPAQAEELYRKNSALIFRNSFVNDVGDLWGMTGARYSAFDRFSGIYPTIGDLRLMDLQRKILIPTFRLDEVALVDGQMPKRTWKAEFFHNFPSKDGRAQEKLVDLIMRSTAAPTYFPMYQGYIDGGVVANNPAMCALAEAINQAGGRQPLSEIVLLSIGTGSRPQFIDARDGNWGLLQWGFKIVDLLMEGDSGLVDYQCRQLLGYRHHRIDAALPMDIGIDATAQIDDLIKFADEVPLGSSTGWLAENWF